MGEPTSAGLHVAERREDQDQVGVLVAFVRWLGSGIRGACLLVAGAAGGTSFVAVDNPHLSRWSVRRRTGPGLSRFRALVLLHPTHRSKQALGLRRLDQRRSHQTPEQGQAPSWAAWCLAKTRSLSTASPVEAADGLPTSLE
ncbi:hypothetical protein HYQ46_000633 [Verticillium longisporum]|nr:hypothetical protein HYQ46_000633 [Verticillium longisporum]